MAAKQIPLTLIVAATAKNGIGKDGALPWPMLKKEMAYFARVTKRVPQATNTGSLQSDALKEKILHDAQRNAVIMGRKTWESIPPKFRPLKDRTNIVISSRSRDELKGVSQDVIVSSSIFSGLEELSQRVREGKSLPLGRAFIIGGSSIYKAAAEMEQTKHILLTRIRKEYECDTFFPVELGEDPASNGGWERQSQEDLSRFVGEEASSDFVKESSGQEDVEFEFQLFERS